MSDTDFRVDSCSLQAGSELTIRFHFSTDPKLDVEGSNPFARTN
jgi:hypothetical protein